MNKQRVSYGWPKLTKVGNIYDTNILVALDTELVHNMSPYIQLYVYTIKINNVNNKHIPECLPIFELLSIIIRINIDIIEYNGDI